MDRKVVLRAAFMNRLCVMLLLLYLEFKSPLMHQDVCITLGGI